MFLVQIHSLFGLIQLRFLLTLSISVNLKDFAGLVPFVFQEFQSPTTFYVSFKLKIFVCIENFIIQFFYPDAAQENLRNII